jgi:hypothetical protein
LRGCSAPCLCPLHRGCVLLGLVVCADAVAARQARVRFVGASDITSLPRAGASLMSRSSLLPPNSQTAGGKPPPGKGKANKGKKKKKKSNK